MIDIDSIRWDDLTEEVCELLSELVKIDTTNPPGNETKAAKFLKEFFNSEGIEAEIIESEPGRGNIIATLPGSKKTQKPLIFSSHLDVVPANPSEWTKPPFSGEISEGYVWGRGSIDCKGLAALEAMTLAIVKRLGIQLKRTLLFIATSDEEMGGEKGIGYLLGARKIEGYAVLNEGGIGVEVNGEKIFLPCFGEKGPLWLKLKVRGTPGHASVPHPDNPNITLVKILDKILKIRQHYILTTSLVKSLSIFVPKEVKSPLVRAGLKLALSFASLGDGPRRFLGTLVGLRAKDVVKAMLRNTLCPTVIKAGYKENVIPEESEAIIDIRLLPGEDPYDFTEKLKKTVENRKVSIQIYKIYRSSESPPDSDFMFSLREAVKEEFPNVPFIPIIATGFTDSRYFRDIGIQSYGFIPWILKEDEIATIHGKDERISIENITSGLKILFRLVLKICS